MAESQKEYFIGLDIGTGSVGWAVTDTEYHILRAKGKDMWGARLFDEAKPAAERRMNRISRRRREREKARIGILKELLAPEIMKVDPGFFHRLDESKFYADDRTGENAGQKYAIFAKGSTGETEYTDVDYYKQYPTIFHLRDELTKSPDKHDVRLVYLALLNMFKHRGHFLNDSLGTDEDGFSFADGWKELMSSYEELLSMDDSEPSSAFPENIDAAQLKEILLSKDQSKSKILEECAAYLGVAKRNKPEYAILKLVVGLTGEMKAIFGEKEEEETEGPKGICFRKSSFEEDFEALTKMLSEEELAVILAAKAVHDALLLDSIKGSSNYICEARVKAYEEHQKDLQLLKKTIRRLAPQEYDGLFREIGDGSYSAYVGSTCTGKGKKIRRNITNHKTGVNNSEPDALYARIKGVLKNFAQDKDAAEILARIEQEKFLQKQLTSANGIIPNQLYVREMKKILENAETYIPYLKTKDETGLTVSEKILKTFSFQIPYYVGPVGKLNDGAKNKWAVRTSGEKITPWNFDDIIDHKATSQAFIENLIRHCTYLSDEKVLPKRSLLYEKFMVLNELNNLKIAGEKISVELKQKIYNELYMQGKPVTRKKLYEFLVSNGAIKRGEGDLISGIDQDLKNYLSSIGKFNGVFEQPYLDRAHTRMIEDIILLGTIYGDSKRMFRERVKEKYGEGSGAACTLSEAQLKRVCGFKFADWGRCSREFLEMEGGSKKDGVIRPLITAMWETNDNLMQLLAEGDYTYTEVLREKTKRAEKKLSEWTFEDLEGRYLSAPVKRMVWQTVRILQEIEEVMGYAPKRIFVEMTRGDGEKGKRTVSRKNKLLDLYRKSMLKDKEEWIREISNREEGEFRIQKLYLYYMQMGRCMYSGEKIDLERLMDDSLYDRDHIYPRHFVKDDSIENNLVLVNRSKNARKSDDYPIGAEIQRKQGAFWKSLLDSGLITKKKYDRLTRVTEFTPEEKADFIQRQLVETGQGTKAVTEILQEAVGDTDIVFCKASLVSEFRKKYEIFKARSVNDLHHAQDAYLNIVVGNVYYVKFTKNPINFMRQAEKNTNDKRYKYHLDKMFDYTVVRSDECAWINEEGGKNNTIGTVKRQVFRTSPLISRRSYITTGGITKKETIYRVGDAVEGAYYPLKTSDRRLTDVKRYGGKRDIRTAAYTLISYLEAGKEIRSLEAIPSFLMVGRRPNEAKMLKYVERIVQRDSKKVCSNFRILIPVIQFNALMKIDGYYYYIAGRTNNNIILHNAVPVYLSNRENGYIKKLEKAQTMNQFSEIDSEGNLVITKEKNRQIFESIIKKIDTPLFSSRKGTLKKSLDKGKKEFDNLSINEQVNVIVQILLAFAANTNPVDLSGLKQGKRAAVMTIGKRINSLKECELINQSITGLFEKRINLLNV